MAVEAKRRDDWERLGWGLVWILNRFPNFSKSRRAPVRMWQVNPFFQPPATQKSGTTKDAAFDALWDSAEDGNGKRN